MTYIIIASLIVTLIDIVGSYYLQGILDEYIPDQLISTLGMITIGLIITYIIQQVMALSKEIPLGRTQFAFSLLMLSCLISNIFLRFLYLSLRQGEQEKSRLVLQMPIRLLML